MKNRNVFTHSFSPFMLLSVVAAASGAALFTASEDGHDKNRVQRFFTTFLLTFQPILGVVCRLRPVS